MENNNRHGSFEMSNFLNILCLLGELQIKSGAFTNFINNDRAKYYFQYGVNRRLSIIAKNLDFFYCTIPPTRQQPLDENETAFATVHLNSLYVNLCGTIDNIAWTLVYEFNLYPAIKNIEEKPERNQINLFNKQFSSKIKKINNSFEEYKKHLDTKNSWYKDLLKFRHPSTHRIPLYVPPSILNESESNKYIHHQAQHLKEARTLNFEKADKHFNQLNSLGTFVPCFAHDPDMGLSPIYPVIITDCESLTEITNQFLDSLMTKRTL